MAEEEKMKALVVILGILSTVIILCLLALSFILESDFTANELNSIGNWIILVGQFMLTTAAQQQLINGRYQKNNGSKIKSDANDHNNKNKEFAQKSTVDKLIEQLKKLEERLENLEK